MNYSNNLFLNISLPIFVSCVFFAAFNLNALFYIPHTAISKTEKAFMEHKLDGMLNKISSKLYKKTESNFIKATKKTMVLASTSINPQVQKQKISACQSFAAYRSIRHVSLSDNLKEYKDCLNNSLTNPGENDVSKITIGQANTKIFDNIYKIMSNQFDGTDSTWTKI